MEKSAPTFATQIAIVVTNIEYIKESIAKIEKRIDAMEQNYIRTDVYTTDKQDFEKRIRVLETATLIQGTKLAIYVGIAVGIIQFLVNKFL